MHLWPWRWKGRTTGNGAVTELMFHSLKALSIFGIYYYLLVRTFCPIEIQLLAEQWPLSSSTSSSTLLNDERRWLSSHNRQRTMSANVKYNKKISWEERHVRHLFVCTNMWESWLLWVVSGEQQQQKCRIKIIKKYIYINSTGNKKMVESRKQAHHLWSCMELRHSASMWNMTQK